MGQWEGAIHEDHDACNVRERGKIFNHVTVSMVFYIWNLGFEAIFFFIVSSSGLNKFNMLFITHA